MPGIQRLRNVTHELIQKRKQEEISPDDHILIGKSCLVFIYSNSTTCGIYDQIDGTHIMYQELLCVSIFL